MKHAYELLLADGRFLYIGSIYSVIALAFRAILTETKERFLVLWLA